MGFSTWVCFTSYFHQFCLSTNFHMHFSVLSFHFVVIFVFSWGFSDYFQTIFAPMFYWKPILNWLFQRQQLGTGFNQHLFCRVFPSSTSLNKLIFILYTNCSDNLLTEWNNILCYLFCHLRVIFILVICLLCCRERLFRRLFLFYTLARRGKNYFCVCSVFHYYNIEKSSDFHCHACRIHFKCQCLYSHWRLIILEYFFGSLNLAELKSVLFELSMLMNPVVKKQLLKGTAG